MYTSPAQGRERQAVELVRDDIDRVAKELDNPFEVIIFESEWQRFLAAGGHVEPTEAETEEPGGETRGRPEKAWRALMPYLVHPVHVTTRKSLGDMTRKLAVTELRSCAQLRGTFSRRNSSVASANWVHVA